MSVSRRLHFAILTALAGTTFVTVAVAVTLASPSFSFFAGDMGLKAIRTQAIATYGPTDFDMPPYPVEIGLSNLPRDQFTIDYNNNTYPVFPYTFSLVSAPPYQWLGYPGLFIVPALSVIVILSAVAWLFHKLGLSSMRLAMAFCFVLGSPIFFYGLTFWEHAPAAALCSVAFASLAVRRNLANLATAGVATGFACLFRPEALLFGIAVIAALTLTSDDGLRSAILPSRNLRQRLQDAGIYGFAFFAAWLPNLAINLSTSGHPLGPQWVYNSNKGSSIAARLMAVDIIFFDFAKWAILILALTAIILWIIRRRVREATFRIVRVVGSLGALTLAFFIPYISDFASNLQFPYGEAAPVSRYINIWYTCAWMTGGLLWLIQQKSPRIRGGLSLWIPICCIGLFLLTLRIPGGVQWGPRYILFVMPPIICLIAARMDISRSPERMLVVIVVLAGFLSSSASVTTLLDSRKDYARLQQVFNMSTAAGDLVATDYTWLYMICPQFTTSRSIFRITGPDDLRAAVTAKPAETPLRLVLERGENDKLVSYHEATRSVDHHLVPVDETGRLQFFDVVSYDAFGATERQTRAPAQYLQAHVRDYVELVYPRSAEKFTTDSFRLSVGVVNSKRDDDGAPVPLPSFDERGNPVTIGYRWLDDGVPVSIKVYELPLKSDVPAELHRNLTVKRGNAVPPHARLEVGLAVNGAWLTEFDHNPSPPLQLHPPVKVGLSRPKFTTGRLNLAPSEDLKISGWWVATDSRKRLEIRCNGRPYPITVVPRPDVERGHPAYPIRNGFQATIPRDALYENRLNTLHILVGGDVYRTLSFQIG